MFASQGTVNSTSIIIINIIIIIAITVITTTTVMATVITAMRMMVMMLFDSHLSHRWQINAAFFHFAVDDIMTPEIIDAIKFRKIFWRWQFDQKLDADAKVLNRYLIHVDPRYLLSG